MPHKLRAPCRDSSLWSLFYNGVRDLFPIKHDYIATYAADIQGRGTKGIVDCRAQAYIIARTLKKTVSRENNMPLMGLCGVGRNKTGHLASTRSDHRARALFSRYSTLAYHAPPISVSTIPTAFVPEIDRWKITTASTMDKTCLTFAIRDISVKSLNLPPAQGPRKLRDVYVPATVMLSGPAFLFVVKLTMLRPNAIAPLRPNATAVQGVSSWVLQCRTRSNSPLMYENITHSMNANGAIRVKRSRGCS